MENEKRCKRCNRILKDKHSQKTGYGPKCYKKKVYGEQKTIYDYIEDQEKAG